MNKKKILHSKNKVFLVLLGFSLISFGGLLFTFIKSSKMDAEHVKIKELAKNVQEEVLLARIEMEEFFIYGDTSLVRNISVTFKNAEDHLSSINTKIRNHKLRNIKSSRNDFIRKLIEVKNKIEILEKLTIEDMLVNSRNNNTTIKQANLDFNKSFGEFEAKLHDYIIRSNSVFKKKLQILLIFSFLILLFCIYIIIKLINAMILADSQIIKKSIEIEQKERHRIAMDLHDGMGSLLSGIGLYIKLLQVEKFDNKGVVNKINQLRQLSDQAYKSLEEVINNTLKHSGAKTAKIYLSNFKNTISLRYTDDGIGFNTVIDDYHNAEKTGLKNIASGLNPWVVHIK